MTPGVDAGAVVAEPAIAEDGTYDLAGIDRTLPNDDLAPLGRITKEADVVALGESIHTSGGFYRAKVRMLEYLVSSLGFRAIAFETPWANADEADAYVQSCAGDPNEAAKKLHAIWWDTSVAELLEWMCKWNAAHAEDRVHFTGFDIRQPWTDGPALRRFFTASSPAQVDALMNGVTDCLGMGYPDEHAFFEDPKVMDLYMNKASMDPAKHDACQAGVATLQAHLATLEASTPQEDWQIARLRAQDIGAFDATLFSLFTEKTKAQQARDAAMHDVFVTLRKLRAPQARVAVWAHNLHITRANPTIEAASYPGAVTFGTLLDRDLGARYVPIGLIGYQVGINWEDGPRDVRFANKGSIETALHTAKRDITFVDLVTPAPAPFVASDKTYEVGGETMKPAAHYAGLVYIDHPAGAEYIGGTSPFAR